MTDINKSQETPGIVKLYSRLFTGLLFFILFSPTIILLWAGVSQKDNGGDIGAALIWIIFQPFGLIIFLFYLHRDKLSTQVKKAFCYGGIFLAIVFLLSLLTHII